MVDEERSKEQLYTYLASMMLLGPVWRRDLIACFAGEPDRQQIADIAAAYFSGDYKPLILMQIDAQTLKRFYLLRDQQ